ncbi:MAG: amidohydrolase [Rhodospirillaceae bacterium]|jgi:aminocarboxymuconate-semialdehyde decarboxylase|nr:amidohydrolase [Rhodospirillaceae bacterium]MBT7486332.1 amidohydrolase [Rhodospirillales bacterium]MBT4700535.1 amidohydrolase [Rhodospirillaceae bacterium]MBT5035596.1 amidohydrolase [Rhodospirillaceae bacterium]MBT6219419.1 amidohydrolase [Rhodospirillaceae bacterium]
MAPIIDIHTHMFGNGWLGMLKKHGGPVYDTKVLSDDRDYLFEHGAPACALEVGAFDYDARIKDMDTNKIDVSIVSLTSPNVFWGGEDVSAETARVTNDEMAEGQRAYPDRIRWLASIPWEYPEKALAELDRSVANGAVGVMVTGHINDKHLIDPLFEPIWAEIDRRGLPVLLHPTAPFGSKEAQFTSERILMPGLGFMFDTTLAVGRMAVDGFFDRYTNLKIIVSHGGGYLPYVAGRLDVFLGVETLIPRKIKENPSEILSNLYYDAILYDPGALDLCLDLAGPGNIMFGTDYPMPYDIDKLYSIIDRLPGDQRDAIKGGNARKMFDL